ncbi:MAG: deoxyribose-phosphate aldolase [Actinomycetota bacterium]|nr:deoxyribose-phosphate aldolase [Acidimicrobiales bacterium]MEC7899124.1 deoxyribose-phosphate aldolase [Actinomycetota bacterium]|tara:strand:+ start:1160 stop:2083 length:924 start_codon:yes stop_codon:yes gene_type:complete
MSTSTVTSVETGLPIRVTPVDEVSLEARASSLATRSIKTTSKRAALHLSIRCMDLTTLEGVDTPEKVASLCQKAKRPDPTNVSIPQVAAVCVYPEMVGHAVEATKDSDVKVASVAGAFPSGLSNIDARTADITDAVNRGADEIDIVLNRSAFLAGDEKRAFEEIVASKEACGEAHLKVILEVGELGSYDKIRQASMLAMAAGADFIKTSTGKISEASSLPRMLCMAEAVRDFAYQTNISVGIKAAGGIRTAKQAWHYLVVIAETLGTDWLNSERFRIGASSLLNDVLLQLKRLDSGFYSGPDYVTVD